MGRVALGVAGPMMALWAGVTGWAQPAPEGPATAATAAQPVAAAPVVRCPVTGRPVDRACVTRFRNRWVYCADAAALAKFLADPYEYADGVRTQWEVDRPLRVQVRCPVTGQVPQSTLYVGAGDEAVYFATDAAREQWLADPAAWQDQLSECYTFQTACATCGMAINPAVTRTVNGRTIYFCCTGCPAAFDRDPSPYLRRVEERAQANETAWKQRRSLAPSSASDRPADHPVPATQPQRS